MKLTYAPSGSGFFHVAPSHSPAYVSYSGSASPLVLVATYHRARTGNLGPGKPAVLSRTVPHAASHALRDAVYKFIDSAGVREDELYDLSKDPEEKHNLAASQPLRAALYRQALHRWVLDLTRETAASADGATLTRKQLENLRALGYVQ